MNLNYTFALVAILMIFSINISATESDLKNDKAPELSYVSHQIDDDDGGTSNGDGDLLPEPGETIEMPVSVINNGDQTANNVSASLFCADADIDVTDANENIGNINSGETAWTVNDFDFEIAPDCPEKDVTFTITFTSDEGVWQEDFVVHIFESNNFPVLAYANHTIDDDDSGESSGDGDGIPESGESIQLALSLENTGEVAATNVSAILSCTDTDIEITDDSESFSNIAVGEEVWSNFNYNFDINPACPSKTVTFTLSITSDQGSWTNNFDIDIVFPGAPDLQYASHTIDDDTDGSSNGDGDGIPEAGEVIEIPIEISNTGILTATGVSATISTTDAHISITDAFEYYPDILPATAEFCDNDFDIEVASDCPEKDVVFNIEIESDQGTWTDSFIIHISEQGLPVLAFEEFTIDDDNDGNSSGNDNDLAEPGEEIELPILIQNTGEGDAHNVAAVLSTNDPFISITDANENYGPIAAGASDWSNNQFDFDVAANCPDKDVEFTLTINSDEGSWTSNFTIHIHVIGTPNLAYASHTIDDDDSGESNGDGDGQPESGESIEMAVSVINNGTQIANNVTASLFCADADIDITDNSEIIGDVLAGETEWTVNDFDFTIDPACPEKDITFTITLTSDEGVWQEDFVVHIFESNNFPVLAYANHSIDDDDSGESNGDDDGIPESGESIELPLSLSNSGNVTATNVSAILTCTDTDIEITDDSESFSNIAVGEEVWSNFNYNFDINPACPSKTVTFTLSITSDQGSWTSDFDIDIVFPGAPDLQYASHTIDDDTDGSSNGDGDGIPEAGEVIEIPIEISNTGILTATGVSATISTTDADISITDAFEYYPDILPATAEFCDNDFDIEVASDCPEKDVVFNMEIESDQGTWNDSFIIHISEQGLPVLAFEEFTIDDDNAGNSSGNDNDLAEPGEEIELPILIQNSGEGDAHNVSAVLSTNDPFISVTDANENYGTIAAGASDWSNNQFDFDVAANCPDKDVEFTLTIISDEGSWTSNFTIHIHVIGTPNLAYASHTIDDDDSGESNGDGDGLAEGGETIEMAVSVTNNGTQIANNVTATLFCADTDIDITDDSEIIGDVLAGETEWTVNDFDFDINPAAPEKDVTFTLTLTSDEGVWQEDFEVHIYASDNPPILAYADHTIDDDTSGESNGDGDGQVEAGESIEIPIAIVNSGGSTAHNVSAILSTNDPDIDIQDHQESYGSIAQALTDWSNNDFDFDVSPTCPEKDVLFTLTITADEGSWTSDFTVHVFEQGLPILAYNNHLIDDDDNNDSNGDGDGIAESGESIELPISLFNSGEAIATNVSAILSCSDSDIDITDNSESFANIASAEEVWSNFNYNFDINPACPDKTVTFILSITSDQGSWTSEFEIDIVHPGSPDLQYSNHIIDDDNSGSSNGDGDGIAEAGEVVEIPIQLINSGIITATGVGATISTNDPDIIITDAFEYYPDILPGTSEWCENDYDIEIADNCPKKDVTITIEIDSDQGIWTDSFIIHISEQGTPQLAFEDFTIDDDNDGNSSGNNNNLAEPGEHIEIPVLIQNIGEGDAHNVSAVLSTEDPFITITDANENYGTIAAGFSDWSNNEFDFNIAAECPDKDVLFTLTINSDEGSWTSNFTVHVHITGTPNLIYASHSIDDDTDGTSNGDGDGQPEPGENIEMPLAISNAGTAPVTNVVAEITCADSDITITDNSEFFGSILAGETDWSSLDYDFNVAYGTPEKDVIFNLLIQSDQGVWNDSFIVHIFPASGAPDLAYLDHSIDDDDDGFSNGNGDGIPSAGETIEMPVLISNTGNAAAHNITAVLSCNDPDIDITDDSENYVDLNSGEQAWSNYAFDFEIASDCPDKVVTFNLQISSDEGTFTQSFTQPIIGAGSPHLIFNSYVIDDDNSGESSGDGDGLVEPGESIEIPVLVTNIGDGPVHGVSGTLTTNDPDIIMDDGAESYGDISEGSSVWSNNDFGFTVADDCPEKDVVFNLFLEGDEGAWNVTFTVHISPLVYYTISTFSNPTNGGTTEGGGSYLEGESCSVNAEAAEGHQFVNWTHQGSIVSITPTYTFFVTENASLIANFEIEEYIVNVSANPTTGGSVSGGGIYQYGETATVTATPNTEYDFIEWTVDGDVVSTNANYSFEVSDDIELVAHFQGDLYVVSVSANPTNGGTVSGGGEYAFGDMATVTATPQSSFQFVNWTEEGTVVSSEQEFTFEVTSNRELVANFAEELYSIDAISIPAGGATIEGAGDYIEGQTCYLEAIPNGGYYFIEWQENGTTVSVNPTYSFTVTESRSLEAHLGVFEYVITTSANPVDAGTVEGGGNFNYDDVVTVSATANTGWEFLSWTFDGQVMSNEAVYTFNVTESMDLQANFITSEYLISAIANPGSGGSIDGDGVYEYGEQATLIATAASSYVFINWTEEDDVVSEDPEFTFTVTSDRSFVAHFEIIQYEITTTANPAAGGTVEGGGFYDYGSTATVVASPNTSYEFLGWTEDGSMVSTNMSYSFSVLENRDLTAVFQFVIGIEESSKNEIQVYPNPVSEQFYFESEKEGVLMILDIHGKEIKQIHIESGKQTLNISELNDGMYFLLFKNTYGQKTIKLVKQ